MVWFCHDLQVLLVKLEQMLHLKVEFRILALFGTEAVYPNPKSTVRKVVSQSKFTEQIFLLKAEQNFKMCTN